MCCDRPEKRGDTRAVLLHFSMMREKLYQKQAEVPLEYAYIADWPASGIGGNFQQQYQGKKEDTRAGTSHTPRKRSSTTKRGGAT